MILTKNKSKYICLFLITFLVLIGLGAISAANTTNQDTTILSDTHNTNTEINTQTNIQQVEKQVQKQENTEIKAVSTDKIKTNQTKKQKTIKKETIQEEANNYEDITNTINSATADSLTIKLNEGTYINTQTITLNTQTCKEITIDGNNQVIDSNENQFLNIGSGYTVTLKNLTIKNAKGVDGGAIYNNGGTLILENITAINNTAAGDSNYMTGNGGFIYSNNGQITINNSNLVNNSAVYEGGVIYVSGGTSLINNTSITGNKATITDHSSSSGAIYVGTDGKMVILNSLLENNTANGYYAHIVHIYHGSLSIDNSTFRHNIPGTSGDVISLAVNPSNPVNSSITNTKFYNNVNSSAVGADMLISMATNDEQYFTASNNTYIGNYLRVRNSASGGGSPSTFGWHQNDVEYGISFRIFLSKVYNDTVRSGNVIVTINGERYDKEFPVENGVFTVTIPNTDLPQYHNVIYFYYTSPDNSYQSRTFNDWTDTQHNTTVSLDTIEDVLWDKPVVITGKLVNQFGTALNKTDVVVTLNGIGHSVVTDDDGVYMISNLTAQPGVNTLTVSFQGNTYYYGSNQATTTFNGLKHNTVLSVDQVENNVPFDSTVAITGKLLDENTTAISGADIVVTVNDVEYPAVQTDVNGVYTVNVKAQLGTNIVRVNTRYRTQSNSKISPLSYRLFNVDTNDVTADSDDTDTNTEENEKYYDADEVTTSFNGVAHDTVITLDDIEDVLFDDEVTVSGRLADVNGTGITGAIVLISGKEVTTTDNGIYTTTIVANPGVNKISVSYNGNESYNGAKPLSTSFNGLPHNTVLTIDNIDDALAGDEVTVTGKLADINGTGITGATVLVNGKMVKTTDNGIYTTTVVANLGLNTVSASYIGNDSYNEAGTVSTSFNGLKRDTILTIDEIPEVPYNSLVTVTGKLTDISNIAVSGAKITVTVNYRDYSTITQEDGTYTIPEVPVKLGTNTITADYNGEGYYNPATAQATVNGVAHDTTLTIDPVDDTLHGNTVTITGTLDDNTEILIRGAEVTVTVNDNEYTAVTDRTGAFKIENVPVNSGKNTIVATYSGNSSYNPSEATGSFNGLAHDTTITLDNIIDVKYGQDATVTGTLLDVNGQAIADATVTVNGEETETDSEGRFKVQITSVFGVNNVEAVYNANSEYNGAAATAVFNGLPHNTQLTINPINDILFNNTVTVTGKLTDAETSSSIGNVDLTVNVNGQEHNVKTLEDGTYTLGDIIAQPGINTITVTYNGNESYNKAEANTTFNGLKHSTQIRIGYDNVKYGEDLFISVTLRDNVNRQNIPNALVKVVYNNNTFITMTNETGQFILQVTPKLGNNNLSVYYEGNDSYISTSIRGIIITGLAHDTSLTVNPIADTLHGNTVNITGTLDDNTEILIRGAEITVTVNDNEYTAVTDRTGSYTVLNVPVLPGTNTVKVNYNGNSTYNQAPEVTTTFTGLAHNTNITINPLRDEVLLNNTVRISGELIDTDRNTTIANTKITVYGIETTTDEDGRYSIVITIPETGRNTITAVYDGEDNTYNPSTNQTRITGLKHGVALSTSQLHDVKYGNNVTITGTLTDSYNLRFTPISGATIIIGSQRVTTDENGSFTANITAKPGVNNVTIRFTGDKYHNALTTSRLFTGLAHDTNITIEPRRGKVLYENRVRITGTLTDTDTNNTIPNAEVTVFGNTTTTTDSEGKYTVVVTIPETGENIITATYNGDDINYNPSGNQTIITGLKHGVSLSNNHLNDVKYGTTVTITGTLTDSYNSRFTPINGAIISVNGQNTITDNEGRYTATITAKPGINNVTISFIGDKYHDALTINRSFTGLAHNTQLVINPVSDTLFDNNVIITGLLKDNDDNTAITDATVTLTVNGADYNTTTDVNGIYILRNVSTKIGENTVTVSYNGNTLYNNASNVTTTFNGLKHNTIVTVDPIDDVKYDETVTVTGKLSDINTTSISDATVTVTVNNNSFIVKTDENGIYTVENVPAVLGKNTITVTYNGNDSYIKANDIATSFNGLAYDTTLTVDTIDDVKYDETVTITGKLSDANTLIADADITVTVNGVDYTTTTSEDGTYSVQVPAAFGLNTVRVNYMGSASYNKAGEVTTSFNGLAHDTQVSVDTIDDAKFGDTVTVTGKLSDENNTLIADANIIVNINGENYYAVTGEDGTYTVQVPVTLGLNTVVISYNGNASYNKADETTTFNGLAHDTVIILDNVDNVLFDDKTTVSGILLDTDGVPVRNAQVTLNDETVTTDLTGRFTTNLTAKPGINTVTVTYNGNDSYTTSTATTTFNGLKHDTTVAIDTIGDDKFDETVNITGKLTDANNTVISDAIITVTVNNNTYTIVTDKTGTYTVLNVPVVFGENTVRVNYNGDNSYNPSSVDNIFNGLKHDTKVTINPIENIVFDNVTIITGELIDTDTSKIIANAEVTIIINDDAYTVRTNGNGTYTLEVPELVGKNTVFAIYDGNESYNPARMTINTYTGLAHDTQITLDKVNDTLFDGKTTVTGLLRDVNGSAINGAVVTVNNVGVVTDNNGRFTATLTAIPGSNNVIVSYNGDDSYNKAFDVTTSFNGLAHNTIVTVESVSDTLSDNSKVITGRLTDANGTIITGQEVIILANGNTYTTTTDLTGTYTVNIPAALGENRVTVSYNGNTLYNKANDIATTFNGLPHDTTLTLNPVEDVKYDDTVTVTGKLSDNNNTEIPDATIIATINGVDYTAITDANGVYTIENIPVTLGQNIAVINYNGNSSYTSAHTIVTIFNGLSHDTIITVEPVNDTLFDNQATITGVLSDVNNTVLPYATIIVTVNGADYTTTTDANGVYSIENVTVAFGENNIIVNYNGNASYNKIENSTKYNGLAHDTIITVNPVKDTLTYENVNITGKLTDISGITIPEAEITVTVNNNTQSATTDANGIYSITVPAALGQNNITVSYNGNDRYSKAGNNTDFNGLKRPVIVTVDPINTIIGEKVTLVAHVTDINGTPVNEGCVVLKLNGKTLRIDESFNSTDLSLKFDVVNGTVTYTLTGDMYLKHIKDFRATYSGSDVYRYNQSNVVGATFIKRNATSTVTINTTNAAQDTDITFTANLIDITQDIENTTALDDGYVLFKINGRTLRDENGTEIRVQVINNTATYIYHVPRGMAATYSNGTVRDYNVSTLYVSTIFNSGTRSSTTLNVEKSPVAVNLENLTMNSTSRKLTVTANITDNNGNLAVGNSKVAIRVNGEILKNANNETLYYTVHEGKINLSYIIPTRFTNITDIELITSENNAYLGAQNKTTNIIIEE